ncbi:TonB family protein [Brevundimonas sp.]|uniref:TonB family protein n=1 Tax=Brevundimonas sp. TaxID=1871086 RepID=UPI0035199538
MKMSHWLAATAMALAMPGVPLAQDVGDDWDLVRDPERNLTMAVLAFDSGPAVLVRCLSGEFEVLLSGLTRMDDQTAMLDMGFDDEPLRITHWWPTESAGLFKAAHAQYLARRLRAGGALTIAKRVAEDEAGVRYVIPLVPSAAAVDAVLSACDLPADDPRVTGDAWAATLPSEQTSWQRRPTPSYPEVAVQAGIMAGRVYVSCVAMPSGEIRDCQADSQSPANVGFDRAALRSLRDARLDPYEPSNAREAEEGRLIVSAIAFRLR